jgi:hypothetical protein
MKNARSVTPDAFKSFSKITVDINGTPEEVMMDEYWGPLELQLDGSARFPEYKRNHAAWRERTSTERNVTIQMVAKKNKQMKEMMLERMIDWELEGGHNDSQKAVHGYWHQQLKS